MKFAADWFVTQQVCITESDLQFPDGFCVSCVSFTNVGGIVSVDCFADHHQFALSADVSYKHCSLFTVT